MPPFLNAEKTSSAQQKFPARDPVVVFIFFPRMIRLTNVVMLVNRPPGGSITPTYVYRQEGKEVSEAPKGFVSGPLTQSPVAAKLLVDLLHSLDVEPAGLRVVHHGLRVMDADYTLGGRLHGLRGVPWVVDILSGETSEDR